MPATEGGFLETAELIVLIFLTDYFQNYALKFIEIYKLVSLELLLNSFKSSFVLLSSIN
jgi:hypothetical protein